MRSHVEFRSSAFPAQGGEEDEINPGRWGMALAEYLADQLVTNGIDADVGGYEDWGVYILVENTNFPLMIGCGNYEEWDDGFLIFVNPSKPEIKKGFFRRKTIDTRPIIEPLVDAIDKILHSHEKIRDIRWWDESEC